MNDTSKSRMVSAPQPGFFKLRLVKGGPWVPARIFEIPAVDPITSETLDRPQMLNAEIDGAPVDVDRVWLFGYPIDQKEFDFLSATSRWARDFAPDEPAAKPREKMDPLKTPVRF